MKYPFHNPDPFVVYACLSLFAIAVTIFFARRILRAKLPELSDQRIYSTDNMETQAQYIKKKIESCWEEDELNTWLGHISKFKKDYHYNYNSKYHEKKLIDAYEQQKTNIYREQLRAEAIIRDMERSN